MSIIQLAAIAAGNPLCGFTWMLRRMQIFDYKNVTFYLNGVEIKGISDVSYEYIEVR